MPEDKEFGVRDSEFRVWVWMFLCLLFLLLTPYSLLITAVHASVVVNAEVDRKEVLIGDRIIYTLYVIADKGTELELPLDSPDFTPFDFVGQRGIEKIKNKGRITYKIDYVLAAYEVGELEAPPQTVYFRDIKGKEGEVASERIKITVKGVVPKNKRDNEIKPVKEPVSIEVKKSGGVLWILLSILFLMAVIITYAFIYLVKNIKRHEETALLSLSPKDVALKELNRIEKLGLIEKGDFRTFHIMIEECVKKFLLNGISIYQAGMTTVELLKSTEPARDIKEILLDCDIVKFGGFIPSVNEALLLLEKAKSAVEIYHRA